MSFWLRNTTYTRSFLRIALLLNQFNGKEKSAEYRRYISRLSTFPVGKTKKYFDFGAYTVQKEPTNNSPTPHGGAPTTTLPTRARARTGEIAGKPYALPIAPPLIEAAFSKLKTAHESQRQALPAPWPMPPEACANG